VVWKTEKKFVPLGEIIRVMENEVREPAVAYLRTTNWQTQAIENIDLIAVSRKGISASQLNSLQQSTGLDNAQLARILQITTRTLQNKKGSDLHSISVSEKALKLSQLYQNGYATFGDKPRFKAWMRSPVLALNNKTPLSYLDTLFGFELVEQVLGRIAHGIIS